MMSIRHTLRLEGLDEADNRIVVRIGFALAIIAVIIRFFFWGYTGRVWEDALITVLHSENFVSGLGLTHYHAGEPPLHGFTSPLSVLVPLLGDLIRVGFGLSFIKIVSAFAAGLTVLYVLAIAIHPRIKLPAPLAVLAMGYAACEHHQILWGMAGMETQLVTLVLLMSMYYLIARRPIALGIALGLCMLARPDFAFWTVMAGLYVLVTDPRGLPKVAIPALIVYLPWILFTTLYYGSPIPNTILAKGIGYPLWCAASNLTARDVVRNVWLSVTGSYAHGAVFQPLGPSFAGHGTFFRPILRDHGLICDLMVALAALGAAAALRKRQWEFVPIIAFVLVYTLYYIFCVAMIFSWYIVPFVIPVLLLSVRGLQAAGSVIRDTRWRSVAFSAAAVAYAGLFVLLLPKTFAAEKRIQEDIENQVRKPMGMFLGEVTTADQSIGCECLGYVAYYSRRTVYDWPGLANRDVVAYSRAHPEGRNLLAMLEHFRPDLIVLRYREYALWYQTTWLDTDYRIIASFEAPLDKLRDVPLIEENIDYGFLVFAKRDWPGRPPEYIPDQMGADPRHGQAQLCIGTRLENQGRVDEALPHYEAAARLLPGDPQILNSLGMALASLGRCREAEDQFRALLSLDPGNARAHNNLGVARMYQNDPATAETEFQQAIALDPRYAEPHANLGMICAQRGQYDEAVQQLLEALRIDPTCTEARLGLQALQQNREAPTP
jgi:tetratricopeptide (TPR) repeat protein